MNALRLHAHGGPENLKWETNLPEPETRPNEVLVEVSATTLNRVDQVILAGYPGLFLELPHALGGDIAGRVAGTDERVAVYPLIPCVGCHLCGAGLFHLCERYQFFGMHRTGGYSSVVNVPKDNLVKLPDSLSEADAACLGVAGLTALHALNEAKNHHRSRGWVMIWGATGGLGAFAIQLAKLRGLRVIATSRTEVHFQALRELGADEVLLTDDPELPKKIRKLTGAGVDQVIDYVGPATFPRSLEVLRKGGVVTLCGILTGKEAPFSLHQTYFRHLSVQGVYLGKREEFEELLGLAASGKVRVPIAREFPASKGAEAHAYFLGQRPVGKVVLRHDQ
jgi:NADPH:quinone reductase-like Zn-dependent oxidoreductase